MGRKQAEAECERLRAALESEQSRTTGVLEQMKSQSGLLAKILPVAAQKPAERKADDDVRPGYVADLVSYQSVKRASQEIVRRLTVVEGLSKDAKILIVDQMNYAEGDLPLVEISQQFGLAEARCRKQVADNRDLLDWVMQNDEKAATEGPAPPREASQRFAFLAAVPAIASAATALPAFAGLVGTVADIAVSFHSDCIVQGKSIARKTESLITAVAGSLRTEKRAVYIYHFASLDTIGTQSKLMKTYTGLLDCSSRLAKTRNQLSYFVDRKTARLMDLQNQLARAEQVSGKRPEIAADSDIIREKIAEESSWLNLANPAILASDAIHGELDSYVRTITRAEAEDSIPKLAQAVFRERIADLGITHLLYIGLASCGGEVVRKRSFLLFPSISYFGGCVASFVLAKKEGEVLVSDTIPILCVIDVRLFDNWIGPLMQVRFDRPELRK
jgi:hypothetical protein